MESHYIPPQPLLRRRNTLDDENIDKYSMNYSFMHNSQQNDFPGLLFDSASQNYELSSNFGGYYDPKMHETQELQRAEAIITDALQNKIEMFPLIPMSSDQYGLGGFHELGSEEHKPDIDENVLDYDNEVRLMQKKDNSDLWGLRQVTGVKKSEHKSKVLKKSLDKTQLSGERKLSKTKKSSTGTFRVLISKDFKSLILTDEKDKKVTNQNHYLNGKSPKGIDFEADGASIEESTVDERPIKISKAKSQQSESPNAASEDADKISKVKSGSKRGRKKKSELKIAEALEQEEGGQNTLTLNKSPSDFENEQQKDQMGSGKRKDRKDYTIYKNSRVAVPAQKDDKVRNPRGRPRKYPLLNKDDENVESVKKISDPVSENKKSSNKNSELKSASEQLESNLPLVPKKKNLITKISKKEKKEKNDSDLLEGPGEKKDIQIEFAENADVEPSNNQMHEEGPVSNEKYSSDYAQHQNQEDDMADGRNNLKDYSFDYDEKDLHQLFTNKLTPCRKYSSVQLNEQPINMMNEEEEEYHGSAFPHRFIAHAQEAAAEHRIEGMDQVAQMISHSDSAKIVDQADGQPIKRKRGRPKKNLGLEAPKDQLGSTNSEPKENESTGKTEGNAKKQSKDSKGKRTLAEAGITDGQAQVEQSGEASEKKSKIKKKVKKTGEAKNQLGSAAEKSSSKSSSKIEKSESKGATHKR